MSDLNRDLVSPADASAALGHLDAPQPVPLMADDPPRVGDFWLDARIASNPAGVIYLGHREDHAEAMVIMLAAGAAADASARDRLAGEVNKLHADTVIARGGQDQDGGRLAAKFRSEEDDPITPENKPLAPWVALIYDGSPAALAEGKRLLTSVDLSSAPPLGSAAGPNYDLPWTSDTRVGRWRIWPLPWPGRHDRAGVLPLFASWLLTLIICGLALLIAVLIFQNAPPETPSPPVSTEQNPSQGNSSGSQDQSASSSDSQSASPSDSGSESQSASPSEGSNSPSESLGESGSPSKDPSMGVSGSGDSEMTATPTTINSNL